MVKQNLYLIKLENKHESFYKIGTSVHRYCRFYQLMKFGYRATIIYMLMGMDCFDTMNAEKYLQGLFKQYIPKTKFGGYSECFKDINIDDYKMKVHYLIPQSKEIVENLEITWR
jgi:hypothetical protein